MQIHDLIKFIGNKDFNGNFYKPDHFNLTIEAVNIDYFKLKHGLPEDYQLGAASARFAEMQAGRIVPRQYVDATQKLSDDLRKFKEAALNQSVVDGKFLIPTNYVHCLAISYNYSRTIDGEVKTLSRPVEILTEDQWADRMGNWIKKPTTKRPIAIIRQTHIYIEPSTINAVDWYYLRLPVKPVFAYTVVKDELVYDVGNSTEFEWPAVNHMDLVRLLLSYLGINLREQQLIQYAEMQKMKGV